MRASGPSSGRATSTTRSSTRPRSPRWPPRASSAWPTCSSPTAAGAGSRAMASTASPHTTALVVHGLQVARQNDLALPRGDARAGRRLAHRLPGQAGPAPRERRSARSSRSRRPPTTSTPWCSWSWPTPASRNDRMLGFLDRDRTHLSVYAKAMFGLGLERLGEKDKLAAVLQNIGQYVVRDDENQTAYLKLPNEGYWWWWYGSEIETDAFYLKLLARTDPKGELAPRLVKYVLNNRRHGSYWNSTRDTAFCIEALADYLKASGEDRPDMTVTIALDGQTRKEVKITPADLFRFDNAFVLEGQALETGSHTVSFTKQGKGPLYYQCLPDQLHARRPDHPRGPGDQGRSQGLSAGQGRQDGGRGRRPRPGGRPAGRALSSRAAGRGGDA